MENNDPIKLFTEFQPVPTSIWEEKITADLKGADYTKKLVWNTEEGFPVRPYYRAEDLEGLEYLNTPPGIFPFLRGNEPSGNRWLVRQDIDTPDIREAVNRAREAVARGAAAIGLNAGNIGTQKDLSDLLSGIDPGKISVNFSTAGSYPELLSYYIHELNRRGVNPETASGSMDFDPLTYFVSHGDSFETWEKNLGDAASMLKTVGRSMPDFRLITINGRYLQDSGATLVQELAFSLASASEYLASLTDMGIEVDDIAPRISFSLGIGPNYFMEIAKLRAARLAWSRLLKEYQAKHDESYRLFIHATTALWNKSIYDPYVNMLRTTTESMSAILGNADSVTTLPFDASFRAPDDFSARVARNQQLVLKEESYLDKIADPAAGSYYIETLTNSLAHHSWELFKRIEGEGGMLACIKSGMIRDQIGQSRTRKESDLAQRKTIMLGTNQYPNPSETMAGSIGLPAETPSMVQTDIKTVKPFRMAAGFEGVRLVTEAYVTKGNKRPSVFLFTMGNLAMLRARAGFIANFFGCAGYEIIDNAGFATVEEGADTALASGAKLIVVCSSDEEYPQIIPEIASRIKAGGNGAKLLVAGYPKEFIEAFTAAGVDDFIHVRSNLLETLRKYQDILGVK